MALTMIVCTALLLPLLPSLCSVFSVLYDTIVSVWSGEQRMRAAKNKGQQAYIKEARKAEWADSFRAGASIVSLSQASFVQGGATGGVSPCALARLLLEEVGGIGARTGGNNGSSGSSVGATSEGAAGNGDSRRAKEVTQALRDPAGFFKRKQEEQQRQLAASAATAAQSQPTAAGADADHSPTAVSATAAAASSAAPIAEAFGVPVSRWIDELTACVASDSISSPFFDSVRQLTGSVYERLLENHLRSLRIPFMTEASLRQSGDSARTPDFLLSEPIFLFGRLVRWLDSKALFADGRTKKEHRDKQLRAYVNRFGPGAVIYWLDFVEGEADAVSTPLTPAQLQQPQAQSVAGSTAIAAAPLPPMLSFTPTVPSHSTPATLDNGSVLLLTDFPPREYVRTIGQLLHEEFRREAGGWVPPPPPTDASFAEKTGPIAAAAAAAVADASSDVS